MVIPAEHWLTSAALVVESLVLVWIAKMLWSRVFKRDLDLELTTHDNPAAAITLAGYFAGVFIALSGVMASPHVGMWQDIASYAAFGGVGVLVLFLSLFGAPLVGGVKLERDIIENRNVASSVVLAATFIATGLIFSGAVAGEAQGLQAWIGLLVFQLLGQVVLAVMAHVFEFITPFDLHKEIKDKQNLAAAMGYAGAMIAIGILLRSAVTGEFVSWQRDLLSFAVYCIPLLLLWPVRALVVNGVLLNFKDLNNEIAVDRNVGVGVIEASAYIGFALLIVAAT